MGMITMGIRLLDRVRVLGVLRLLLMILMGMDLRLLLIIVGITKEMCDFSVDDCVLFLHHIKVGVCADLEDFYW
jgi:hypothetical protein